MTVGIPQIHRGDTSLTLWALNDTSSPVHVFSGHTEGIYDFFWRSPRNNEYQLVSWSKDQSLRLWKTDSSVQKQCGAAYLNHIVLDYPHFEGHLFHGREHFSTNSLLSAADGNGASPPGSPVSVLDRELRSVDLANVVVDEIDLKLRSCVVAMTSGHHLVKMSVSFPLGYPGEAMPPRIIENFENEIIFLAENRKKSKKFNRNFQRINRERFFKNFTEAHEEFFFITDASATHQSINQSISFKQQVLSHSINQSIQNLLLIFIDSTNQAIN